MKLLIAFFSLLLVQVTPPYLLVDRDLKKPLSEASTFSTEQYLQRTFPVYKTDVNEIIDAVDLALKAVEKNTEGETRDSISAAHTTIVIEKNVSGNNDVNIILVTTLAELHTTFSFALVRSETDVRKAQRRLLDFATYINP